MAASYPFNAFISYSHARDAGLARALQTGLERFAKPWYRVRAARVFRDTANLAANPDLWRSVTGALAEAEWLIVVASAPSAASAWVNREVEWWLAHRSADRLLVVAAGPGLAWDGRDWAPDAPVPPALRGAFAAEPLWVDLSDLRPEGLRPRIEPERLATIAAAIHGVPKDTIIGDHLRERRRTVRTAGSAVAVLAVATVAAIIASLVAVGQRDAAQAQARLATSRELAALAVSEIGTNLDVAGLLAVAAYRTEDTPQAESALLQADAAAPHLVRFLPAGGTVTALAATADGTTAVAGTSDGRLIAIDVRTGKRRSVATGLGSISDVAASANGDAIAATDGTSAVIWVSGRPLARMRPPQPVRDVAVSPAGTRAALLYGPTADHPGQTGPAHVLVRDGDPGRERLITVPRWYEAVAIPSESRLTLSSAGSSGEWSLPDLRMTARYSGPGWPATDYISGTSGNGEFAAYSQYGNVWLWGTGRNQASAEPVNGVAPDGVASDLAVSPAGNAVALTVSGSVYLARGASYQSLGSSPQLTQLSGGGAVNRVSFLGDDTLVSASGASLELWDLRQDSRIGKSAGASVPNSLVDPQPPALAFSPGGGSLALVDGDRQGLSVFRYASGLRPLYRRMSDTNVFLPLWRGKELLFLAEGDDGRLRLTDEAGRTVRTLGSIPAGVGVLSARITADRDRLIVVDATYGVRIYDLGTGHETKAFPSTIKGYGYGPERADISPDGTGAVVTEWGPGTAGPTIPLRAEYIDLRTGRARVLGTGGADDAVFAGGDLLVQRDTGDLEIWNSGGTRLLRTLPGSGGYVPALAVSPDGAMLARLHSDGTASVTDLATGDTLATFSLPYSPRWFVAAPWESTALAFTPDGKDLLTATAGGAMTEWNLAPDSLIASACAVAGRSLTAAEWREYVQTSPPANLSCATGSGAG